MMAVDYSAVMAEILCNPNATSESSAAAANCTGKNCVVGSGVTPDCALFDFILYTVIGGALCAFGLVGNALSFVVLHFGNDHSSKTAVTTLLLRALAVADSLVLLTSLPLYALEPVRVYTHPVSAFHYVYAVVMPYLWPLYLMSLTATIMLTVLVSFHRYSAVCRPYNSTAINCVSRCQRHIIYIALAAVLYNIPRFFEYRRIDIYCPTSDGLRQFATSMNFFSAVGENHIFRVVYDNIVYFVVMLGGPLILLAFLNAKLITALKEKSRRRREMGGVAMTTTRHNQQQQQQDLTITLVVVVFVFIVCQTPTFIDRIIWAFFDKDQRQCGRWHYYYTAVGDLMVILNSSVNFIVYVLASRKFRHDLYAILRDGPCRCRRRPGVTEAEAGGSLCDAGQNVSVAERVSLAGLTPDGRQVTINTARSFVDQVAVDAV